MSKFLAGERYLNEELLDTGKSYELQLDIMETQDTGNGNEVIIAKVTGHAIIQHVLVFSDQKNLFRSLKRNTGGVYRVQLLEGGFRRYSRTLRDGSSITGFTVGSLQLMVNRHRVKRLLQIYGITPEVPETTQ